jgi:NADH:ubiquinone oxidoreductase subunit F (NADH-binding)/Pyruvate/2-oxoacid:ferredoxin oxidoreductase delta subunit/(2Fe-2S) ferredoxin
MNMEANTNTILEKDFWIQSVLLADAREYPAVIEKQLRLFRRDKVERPVVTVGMNTCSVIAGAERTFLEIKQYIFERKINASLIAVGCDGFCAMEPLVSVQLPGKARVSFRNVTSEKVYFILDSIFNNIIPEEYVLCQYPDDNHELWKDAAFYSNLPFYSLQKRKLLELSGKINPESIFEYIAFGGYRAFVKTIRNYTPESVCDILEKSGLQGRGGGGFLAGTKWKIAHSTVSDQRYIICNADDSDPGAFTNRALIESNPHLLIEGLAIAAYAVGTSRAYIYIRNDYNLAISRLNQAIQEAASLGLIGHNIHGSGFNLDVVIRKGAGAFVCGEETALISSIEGKRGMPRTKPPYPAIMGLFGKPTVVNNVETLANVPGVFRHGPDWLKVNGNNHAKGTKLLVLNGKVKNHGVVEVPMGTSIQSIVFDIGGGVRNAGRFKAVQIGGPSGGFLIEENIDTPLDYHSLREHGIFLGSGGVTVLDYQNCIIDTVRFFMDFIQKESCGKCIPCREGSARMLEIFENITKRPVSESGHNTLERFKGVMQLESLAEVIKDTSLCGLGQKAPNPVISSLKYFRTEYEEHIFDRKCTAGVCKELRLFYIEVDMCTGCTVCKPKCPTQAIIGTKIHPHFIIEEKCIGCGICFDVCKFSAISVK